MVLPRPSNVGILISGVLVCALGLGANFFIKIDPDLFQFSGGPAEETKEVVVIVDKEPVVEPPPEPQTEEPGDVIAKDESPEEIPLGLAISDLAKFDAELKSAHSKWEQYGFVAPELRRQLGSISVRTLQLMRHIQSHPDATGRTKRSARMDGISVAFYAAEMNQRTKDTFRQISDEAFANSESELDRARVQILQMLVLMDYSNPDVEEFLSKLNEFGDTFPNNDADAIFLYLSVAKKLTYQNHRELSNRVLQQGIRRYRKGNTKALRLINLLIGQGGKVPS